MNLSKKFWQNAAVAVIGIMMATAAAADNHGNRNKIIEPGQEYHGYTYNELVGEWTNWFVKEPIATHPAFDPDGRFCDRNQQGKVWFLTGTYEGVANRTCEIPAGKAIFLSFKAFVSFAPEFPAAGDPCLQMGTDLEKVRCDVNDDIPVAPGISLQATLDGEPVEDLFAFRAQSQPGGFTLRVANPSFITDLGLPAGNRFPAVADGYFLFLKPLKPGTHTLSFRMITPGQPDTGANYTLIVGGDD